MPRGKLEIVERHGLASKSLDELEATVDQLHDYVFGLIYLKLRAAVEDKHLIIVSPGVSREGTVLPAAASPHPNQKPPSVSEKTLASDQSMKLSSNVEEPVAKLTCFTSSMDPNPRLLRHASMYLEINSP
ncbi:MAG: hypothetical protein DRJ69_03785 [Thermoprotei archaeon]|nr:MAG: hypothetical protein DRJ69_03785 [Thermoprotei archaeon]